MKNYVLPPKQKILMLGMAAVLIAVGLGTYAVFQNTIGACVSVVIGVYLIIQMNKTAENVIM